MWLGGEFNEDFEETGLAVSVVKAAGLDDECKGAEKERVPWTWLGWEFNEFRGHESRSRCSGSGRIG
jgi:hypothetical protein